MKRVFRRNFEALLLQFLECPETKGIVNTLYVSVCERGVECIGLESPCVSPMEISTPPTKLSGTQPATPTTSFSRIRHPPLWKYGSPILGVVTSPLQLLPLPPGTHAGTRAAAIRNLTDHATSKAPQNTQQASSPIDLEEQVSYQISTLYQISMSRSCLTCRPWDEPSNRP